MYMDFVYQHFLCKYHFTQTLQNYYTLFYYIFIFYWGSLLES